VYNGAVSIQPHDMVGVLARVRPFLGQLGTTPSHPIPDSHNAGDFGSFLIGAPHDYALTKEELMEYKKTDGQALKFAKTWDLETLEDSLSISFIGTGANLIEATENGMPRAAE
jgi:Acetamidase/Formamidase family